MNARDPLVNGLARPGSTIDAPADAPLAVCIAGENFYPVYAGPAIRFGRYLPGFRARGIEVAVFSGTPARGRASASSATDDMTWLDRKCGDIFRGGSLHGVPITRVRLPDAMGRRRQRLFARKLVDFCVRADSKPRVVQLLSCDFSFIPALLRLRRHRIPTIFTVTLLAGDKYRGLRRELRRRYFALPLQLVTHVVVSSGVMRDALRGLPFTTPIRIIPNGVDIKRFHPARDGAVRHRIREQLGIGSQDIVALFVGPISPRKGADLLLAAWSHVRPRYPRLHLVLVGPTVDDATGPSAVVLNEEVKRLTSASGAAERLHFTGLVENVEEYMRAADFLLFTSRREGMPNVVPEAMATGLPVVTTPFIGLPTEFGRPGEEYLLADFQPESIAAAIDRVLENPECATQLGRSARRWVENHLDIDRSVGNYADLYAELASERHQRWGRA